jgi:hypothetical protein
MTATAAASADPAGAQPDNHAGTGPFTVRFMSAAPWPRDHRAPPTGRRPAVLWMTLCLDAAVEQLGALPADQREQDVLNEVLVRRSPPRTLHRGRHGAAVLTPLRSE